MINCQSQKLPPRKVCKIKTENDRIRLANIDFQNLHEICEILMCSNPVHLFVHDFSKSCRYLMDYQSYMHSGINLLTRTFLKVVYDIKPLKLAFI